MPDDVKPQDEQVEDPQDEQVTEPEGEQPAADEPEGGDPHPLEPGGKRFSEVYRDMKDARREAQELRDRIARLEGSQQTRQLEPQQQTRHFTSAELQVLVDQGKIQPAQMADQLAWQRADALKRELRQEAQVEQRRSAAQSEIRDYVKEIPALTNQGSAEFQKVMLAAREIADELERPMDDPVVQRRALREALGSIEKIRRSKQVREQSRQNADTHVERPGGTREQRGGSSSDPLRGVPQRYLDHWKRLSYSREAMIEEAKLIRRRG